MYTHLHYICIYETNKYMFTHEHPAQRTAGRCNVRWPTSIQTDVQQPKNQPRRYPDRWATGPRGRTHEAGHVHPKHLYACTSAWPANCPTIWP